MKSIAIISAASFALLTACGQNGDRAEQRAGEAVDAAQDAASGVVGQTSAATLGANTVEGFVTGLAVGNLYELRAAEIAQSKSGSAQVKELASMITRDHVSAGEKLSSTAPTAAPDVTIPAELDQRRQGLIDNLNAASAADFDRVYLEQQVAAHNETLTLLNGFSDNADAPALASLARELVPPVTQHRDRARQLLDAM